MKNEGEDKEKGEESGGLCFGGNNGSDAAPVVTIKQQVVAIIRSGR